MTTSRNEELDPDIAKLVRVLARQAAQRDHDEILHGKKPEPKIEPGPALKSRLRTMLRIADGQGGYSFFEPDPEGLRLFKESVRKAAEDMKAGRDDDLGISKMLKRR